ncbi:hypothetical protein TanjilG_03195 [Lupinus angustifolius]|uniref:Nucleoplasmin-like domain-containing protein n=1 Tax=Lupinus angustifolius TaxID=3871 RepID=A0A4P1RD70_LUPAN|nr:hypothetical protein TanjilG_03195 [Lupinus angustifolius]
MSVPMEFWGAEVKVGQVVKVDQNELLGVTIHLSQIALGESKKDKANEPVIISLKVDDKKFVLGTLTRDGVPQFSLDLYLDSEFELSHNSKNSSVYFSGYKVENDIDDVSDFSGNKVETADPKKDNENESDDDSVDEDDFGSSDELGANSDDEIDSDEDESEEETPVKKVDQSKKRPNGPASKAPIPAKKAKNATPEKTDGGKKGVQKSTPHPVKKGGKNFNKKGQRS